MMMMLYSQLTVKYDMFVLGFRKVAIFGMRCFSRLEHSNAVGITAICTSELCSWLVYKVVVVYTMSIRGADFSAPGPRRGITNHRYLCALVTASRRNYCCVHFVPSCTQDYEGSHCNDVIR